MIKNTSSWKKISWKKIIMKNKDILPYVVRKSYLQQYNTLFGGRLLSLIDKTAHEIICKKYPNKKIVTTQIIHNFTKMILKGDIVNYSWDIDEFGRNIVIKYSIFSAKRADSLTDKLYKVGFGIITFRILE